MSPEIKNAIIKNVRITNEEFGCLTIWVDLCYGLGNQSFGGYSLFSNNSTFGQSKNYTGHFINRLFTIAGVNSFDQLQKKPIRAMIEDEKIIAIGHFLLDFWFNPKEEFKNDK
jgi:hypothetical protein